MPLGRRADEMQHMPGPMAAQHGSTHNFSAALDETDDYMDYVGGGGGSPLGLSSESSNQDRSCTSTPVGNDSSPAGEIMQKYKQSIKKVVEVLGVGGGMEI